MGTLDEAIREHLRLKLKQGADPSEVKRLENEALSPVQEPAVDSGYADNNLLVAEPIAAVNTGLESELDPSGLYSEPFSDQQDVEIRAVALTDETVVDQNEEELEAVDTPTGFKVTDTSDTKTVDEDPQLSTDQKNAIIESEWLAREHDLPTEASQPDVLEETPDFLSETPDHDQLWFEQRSPNSFDFDR